MIEDGNQLHSAWANRLLGITRRALSPDKDLRGFFHGTSACLSALSGASVLSEVVERLGAAAPSHAAEVDVRAYKGLVAPWNDWTHVARRGRHWASVLAHVHLKGGAS